MRRLRLFVLVSLSAAAAVASCTLNPQPLPPSEIAGGNESDASLDSGSLGTKPTPPAADAAPANASEGGSGDIDGGTPSGDSGADAGEDADAG